MKELLKKFENKEPEIIFNWKDAETEAEGWTVINGSEIFGFWTSDWWC
jgi:hypothetical protein